MLTNETIPTPNWIDLKNIQSPLNTANYYQEIAPKNQIYIHHLASDNWQSAKQYWENRKGGNGTVATPFIISRKGEIIQLFDERFWAWHLSGSDFVKLSGAISSQKLNKQSIAIELESWGWLNKIGENYYGWTGKQIDQSEVIELEQPHRGYQYYHSYTDAQIEATAILANALCEKYNIPKTYNNLFQISEKALKGEKGVFGHNNTSSQKSDPYPDPKLIEALKLFTPTAPL